MQEVSSGTQVNLVLWAKSVTPEQVPSRIGEQTYQKQYGADQHGDLK